MSDREKMVELINHVAEGHVVNLMQPGGAEALADHLIANGVRIVVCCNNCVNHGHCIPEDTFRFVRMEKPFCAAGKERSEPQ